MNINQSKKNIIQSLFFLFSLIILILIIHDYIHNYTYIVGIITFIIFIYSYTMKTKDYLNNLLFIGIPSILVYLFIFSFIEKRKNALKRFFGCFFFIKSPKKGFSGHKVQLKMIYHFKVTKIIHSIF